MNTERKWAIVMLFIFFGLGCISVAIGFVFGAGLSVCGLMLTTILFELAKED